MFIQDSVGVYGSTGLRKEKAGSTGVTEGVPEYRSEYRRHRKCRRKYGVGLREAEREGVRHYGSAYRRVEYLWECGEEADEEREQTAGKEECRGEADEERKQTTGEEECWGEADEEQEQTTGEEECRGAGRGAIANDRGGRA